jgi:hypothetical protein
VADRGDRFARVRESADEINGLPVHSHLVGILHAAGQHQRIEFSRICVLELEIDLECIGRLVVVPALHLLFAGRDQHGFRTGFVQRLARFGHFHLLEPVLDQYRDAHA